MEKEKKILSVQSKRHAEVPCDDITRCHHHVQLLRLAVSDVDDPHLHVADARDSDGHHRSPAGGERQKPYEQPQQVGGQT